MSSLNTEDWRLLHGFCNESLPEHDLKKLEHRLKESAELRKEFRHLTAMDSFMRESLEEPLIKEIQSRGNSNTTKLHVLYLVCSGLAASLIIAFSYLFTVTTPDNIENNSNENNLAMGFAVIENLNDIHQNESKFKIGDTVGAEKIQFSEGWLQLEFYSGASILVEGPCKLEIVSAWELICHEGKLVAQVPPAARGFLVRSEDTKVVDLGTEFSFEVNGQGSKVQVFDGEVKIDTAKQSDLKLLSGQALHNFSGESKTTTHNSSSRDFLNYAAFNQSQQQLKSRFQNWKNSQETWLIDTSLIAYYPLNSKEDKTVLSHTPQNRDLLKGKLIQGHYAPSRWNQLEPYGSLNFSKSGSRVRVHIPNKLTALTLSSWVRVYQLGHKWNSLFLTDSHEWGEPHWQITEDGKLLFCVSTSHEPAKDIGTKFTHFYLSPKIFTEKNFGQWLHITTTYDIPSKKVYHYLNGEKVSEETMHDGYITDHLIIGNAEIGNWSQPARKDPYFALRNLNGDIDDFMIFNKALEPKTVKQLYNDSKNF